MTSPTNPTKQVADGVLKPEGEGQTSLEALRRVGEDAVAGVSRFPEAGACSLRAWQCVAALDWARDQKDCAVP